MKNNGSLALSFHVLFLVFMLAPILVVCVVAFTSEGYLSLPTNGPSLRWFRAMLMHPEFITAFRDSVWLGVLASTVAIGFAVPAALAIARHDFPGRTVLASLFMSPLTIPHVVLGIAFLRFFSELGLNGRFAGLVIAHVIVVFPFALRLVLAASWGIDRRIEHAAVSLGAGNFTVFRRVTLPLILPGVASGWTLAFLSSFDEVTMTVFIAAPETTTLPVRLLAHIQDNIDPLVAAVSATLIVAATLFLVLLDRLYGLDRLFLGQPRH